MRVFPHCGAVMLAPHDQIHWLEVFVQLGGRETAEIEVVALSVESLSGRILHAFPPRVMIVSIPARALPKLMELPGVEAVSTDRFDEGAVEAAAGELRHAMAAWNEHLSPAVRRGMAAGPDNLSWDTPGRLPPDPPLEVRERHRRREAEMQSDSDSDPNLNT